MKNIHDLAEKEREELMQTLRDAMRSYGDINAMSMWIGRTPSCLYSIMNGKTKWPQVRTIFALANFLNLKLAWVSRGRNW